MGDAMESSIPQNVNIIQPFRTCTGCGQRKPTTRENFGTKKNGLPRPRCRVCVRDATNKHALNNRELGRARARNRKERLEAVGVVNEHLVFKDALLAQQNYACYFCDIYIDEATAEVDHLTPIVRGGNNELSNLAACCGTCNRAKKDRTENEFREIISTRFRHYA
jgi:5-methylcytosine-specific restriction protein A